MRNGTLPFCRRFGPWLALPLFLLAGNAPAQPRPAVSDAPPMEHITEQEKRELEQVLQSQLARERLKEALRALRLSRRTDEGGNKGPVPDRG